MLGLKNKISSPLTVYYIDFFNVHYQQDCGLCAYLHLVFTVKFPSCTSNHVIYYQLNANRRKFWSEFYPHASLCTHGLSWIFVLLEFRFTLKLCGSLSLLSVALEQSVWLSLSSVCKTVNTFSCFLGSFWNWIEIP